MDSIATVHSITEKVPAEAIKKRFGVKDRSIRLAREREVFPASWYIGMKELCAKYGAAFSDDLFNMKAPGGGSATKRGHDPAPIQGEGTENVDGASA